MKENDVNDINEIHNNDNNNMNNAYMEMYGRLTDIPSRLQFIIDGKVRFEALKAKGEKVSEKEEKQFQSVVDMFVDKYVAGGSEDNKNCILEYLYRIKNESENDLENEYKRQLAAIDKNDGLRIQKARWYADQMGARIDNNVVTEVMHMFAKTFYKKSRSDKDMALINGNPAPKASTDGIEDWIDKTGRKSIRQQANSQMGEKAKIFKERYEKGLKPIKIDRTFHDNVYKLYHSRKTMKEKLKLLIDYNTYLMAKRLVYDSNAESGKFTTQLFDEFGKEYIGNGKPEMNKAVFVALGEIMAENKIELLKKNLNYRETFKNEGKTGVKKADHLSFNTSAGYGAQSIRMAEMQLRFWFVNSQKNRDNIDKIWDDAKIDKNTTLEEYIIKSGMDDKEREKYIEVVKNNMGDDNLQPDKIRMVEYIIKCNEAESENEALRRIKDGFIDRYADLIMTNIENKKKESLNDESKAVFDEVGEKINGVLSTSGIENWLNDEGKRQIAYNSEIGAKQMMNDFEKSYFGKSVDYDQYIRLHTGKDVVETDGVSHKKEDCLAKAIAANILKKANVKFSIDEIHAAADKIKARQEFKNFCVDNNPAFMMSLSGIDGVNEAEVSIFGKPFAVDKDNINKYINKISYVFKRLMTAEGGSRDYIAFYDSVKKVNDLSGSLDFNNEADKLKAVQTILEFNMNIVNTAENYITGKEKERSSQNERERFNNVIDVLAVISDNAPGAKAAIESMVNNVNAKRKAGVNSSKYIKLSEYGIKRADKAMRLREHMELETEEEIGEAYAAQQTMEEKFFYSIYYSVRNGLITKSGEYISEKERMELNMPVDDTVNISLKKTTEFQEDMHNKANAVLYWDIRDHFFADKNRKKNVTLDGVIGFYEFFGALSVKPLMDIGKRYNEVSEMIPRDGNTSSDMEYKTKYLLKNGLAMESNVLMDTIYGIDNTENTIIGDDLFYTRDKDNNLKSNTLKLDVKRIIYKIFDEHLQDNMETFMDAMKITDAEEREAVLKNIGCNGNNSIEEVKVILGKSFHSKMWDVVTCAWNRQGYKKKLGSLNEQELKEFKLGKEVNETGAEKKYKSWIAEEGDELIHELQYRTYKDAFRKCNEIIKSTTPIGYSYPKKGKMLSYAEIDNIDVTDIKNKRYTIETKADTAYKKTVESMSNVRDSYSEYLRKHTGQNKIVSSHEKNVEMLSKAMAAGMLCGSKYVTKYSTDMIHETADRLKKTMKLSELSKEEVKKALESPKTVDDMTKAKIKELYTPAELSDCILDMRLVSKYMMVGKNRSKEYQNLIRAVKRFAMLNEDKYKDPKVIEDSRERGMEVLRAVETYIKGKKSIRHSDEGKERFDNAMDALAVLKKYIPGLGEHIDLTVERINTVRGAKEPNAKGHIDLEKYGAKRAEEAKRARSRKDQGIKPDKQAVKPVVKK